MKKIIFLKNLYYDEKIKLVEPNKNIANSYLKKSEKSLISSKALLEIENYEDAITLAYFSMYNCLTSLLFKTGIKSENHAASIILLKEIFNINNSQITEAKKERIDKQYYIDESTTRKETEEIIECAEEFNAYIEDFISKLNISDISKYREKLKQII